MRMRDRVLYISIPAAMATRRNVRPGVHKGQTE
jgi:hypothetical protein